MEHADMIQGSTEWLAARAGSLGASRVADMLAKTRNGWGASRANLAAELVAERLTGVPYSGYVSKEMAWGTETEPQAIAAYEFYTGAEVSRVGLVRHPVITGTHASPDGLVGNDGLVEIKCPSSATHIETLLGGEIPRKYILQMQWQMACTARAWCDFVSFDPRMPESMRMFLKRVARDEKLIAELKVEAEIFLAEVCDTVSALKSKYEQIQEAA